MFRFGCFCLSILAVWLEIFCFPAAASPTIQDTTTAFPNVSAQSAILIEAESGQIIYEKNAQLRLPMASTTKIMTAIVAMELADPSTVIQVSPLAVGIEGSSVYLYAGEQLSLENLLYALLLESANDAAVAIAIAVAGDLPTFVERMNQKASELGLENTHFTNPHGLDHEEHYTTAADLARLAAYCMKNELFRTVVATQRMTIPLHTTEGVRLLLNHNRLLRTYPGTIGLKTGFTKRSGRCLVSAALRDHVQLIAVTLNAPRDWQDHRDLFDFGFAKYVSVSLISAKNYVRQIPVIGAVSNTATVSNATEMRKILSANHGKITMICEAPHIHFGGVYAGQPLGRLIWYCDGAIIASTPLYAQESIPALPVRASLWTRIKTRLFKLPQTE